MRTIKFRAWDKKAKRMVKVMRLWFPEVVKEGPPEIEFWEDTNDDAYPITFFELMQFTGLLDKNGKEIYEGDIYKTVAGETPNGVQTEEIYRIKFNHGAFVLVKINGLEHGTRYLGSKTNLLNGEILGNIYENKELLK